MRDLVQSAKETKRSTHKQPGTCRRLLLRPTSTAAFLEASRAGRGFSRRLVRINFWVARDRS